MKCPCYYLPKKSGKVKVNITMPTSQGCYKQKEENKKIPVDQDVNELHKRARER